MAATKMWWSPVRSARADGKPARSQQRAGGGECGETKECEPMPENEDEARQALLDEAARRPGGGTPDGVEVGDLPGYLRAYYRHVAVEDLVAAGSERIAAVAAEHARLGAHRPQGRALVRVRLPAGSATSPSGHGPEAAFVTGRGAVDIVTDDMPFLVDSVTMELNRHGLDIHVIVHPQLRVRRDVAGLLHAVSGPVGGLAVVPGEITESWTHIEIGRPADRSTQDELEDDLRRVLDDVRVAVEDQPRMRSAATRLADDLADDLAAELGEAGGRGASGGRPSRTAERDRDDDREAEELLRWLTDGHFTFLGYREYDLLEAPDGMALRAVAGTGLGILRHDRQGSDSFAALPPDVRAKARERQRLILTKANSRSTVYRPNYLDYVAVKKLDETGEVAGEFRFLGLYTHAAYAESVARVPVLRRKLAGVLDAAGVAEDSHDGEDLAEILESYPREELLQISADELTPIALGVLRLGERKQTRLFLRKDAYGRYMSCLVYLPRDRYTTQVRLRTQEILRVALSGVSVDYSAMVGESALARLHVVVRGQRGRPLPDVDAGELEKALAASVRSWDDDLAEEAAGSLGAERAQQLIDSYGDAIPESYKAAVPAVTAVTDLIRVMALQESGEAFAVDLREPAAEGALSLAGPAEGDAFEAPRGWRLRVYRAGAPITLSDVLPQLQHMGVEVVDEHPYEFAARGGLPRGQSGSGPRGSGSISRGGAVPGETVSRQASTLTAQPFWIYDFGLRDGTGEEPASGERGITGARLPGAAPRSRRGSVRDGTVKAMFENALIALWNGEIEDDGFNALVLDARLTWRQALVLRAYAKYLRQAGTAFSQDYIQRVLRSNVTVTRLLVRLFESRFEPARRGGQAERSEAIAEEIRGELDEVVSLDHDRILRSYLALIQATLRTNFYQPDHSSPSAASAPYLVDREAYLGEVLACYRMFISAMLDVTDNSGGGRVVPPPAVVRHDGDDPYLVVAADKGTATFSDVANEVAAGYGFWLGDAFASGGSEGYDHKRMGITARGAWESVKFHFRMRGLDVDSDDFVVIGIGDMSGDVFGNGMLLSRHIKLVAAFDHRHVFLDPGPDPAASFAERQRLFALPRSSWADYDASLISPGGGVWSRTAKSVPVSAQARATLGLDSAAAALSPDELISAVLSAPADLLWNGGVGTYVKATTQSHADAGDRSNDAVRVNAIQLRAKAVAEGGNLGLTQAARIEYAHAGGLVNTDFIDNSAGVDTSDHEVNIKILLDQAVRDSEITRADRNRLLHEMTGEGAELVLRHNYHQNIALAAARAQAPQMLHVHARYLRKLERDGRVSRGQDALPGDREVAERRSAGLGLTAPEFALVLAHTKIASSQEVLAAGLPDDPHLRSALEGYFPAPLRARYAGRMNSHPLRREIITTAIVNDMVDTSGTTFTFRLNEETGASVPDITRAWLVAREVFEMPGFWAQVERLDGQLDVPTQLALLLEGRKLTERATRWLLHNRRPPLRVEATVEFFAGGVLAVGSGLPKLLTGRDLAEFEQRRDSLAARGVPSELAERAAGMVPAYSAFDIVEIAGGDLGSPPGESIAAGTRRGVEETAEVYFDLADRLQIARLRDRITALPREDRWSTMARAALRDDLFAAHAALARDVLGVTGPGSPEERLAAWVRRNEAAVTRARQTLTEIWESDRFTFATLSVAVRAIRTLVTASALPDPA